MNLRFLVVGTALFFFAENSLAGETSGKAKHVVVVVWDGMRPDFVTNQNTPTLAAVARNGVTFANNHSAFPSSTNVNGVVLATGGEPMHNGVIANEEYRAEIDPRKSFDTADFPELDQVDGRFANKFIAASTVAEIVQKAGYRTAIAGSKTVAQLADRSRHREADAARESVVV